MAGRNIVGNLKFPLMTAHFVGIFESETQFVCLVQWRIQDFPEGGAQTPKSAIIFFAKNYMKMKEFGPRGVCVPCAPLDPSML